MSHLFPLQESYAYRAWFVPPAEHRWVIPTDASNLHTTRGGSDGFRPDGVRRHSGPTGLCGAGGGGGGGNNAGGGGVRGAARRAEARAANQRQSCATRAPGPRDGP